MMSRVIIGGIVGAIVLFIWMMVSWMVLPWHGNTIEKFTHPQAVARVIDQNTPKDGVYMFPCEDCHDGSPEQMREVMMKGPFIYAQVRKGGMDPFSPGLYIVSFLEGLVGALFVCYLFRVIERNKCYIKRVVFAAVFGLVVGILGTVPSWNWMGGNGCYTIVLIADFVIAYLLLGIVVAGFVKPRES